MEFCSMNIYATHGTKVIAKNLDWGYDCDAEKANRLLEQDKVYTVDHTEVFNSSTDVYLVEFPNESFNSVHFIDWVE